MCYTESVKRNYSRNLTFRLNLNLIRVEIIHMREVTQPY